MCTTTWLTCMIFATSFGRTCNKWKQWWFYAGGANWGFSTPAVSVAPNKRVFMGSEWVCTIFATGFGRTYNKWKQWWFYDPTQCIIGYFGDESSQVINCTGTDDQKQGNETLHTSGTEKANRKDPAVANKAKHPDMMVRVLRPQETKQTLF